MTPALRVKGLVKSYGRRRALDGLSFKVPEGSVFGMVGSNGAGKTTALIGIAGLLKLQGGKVDLLGQGPFDPAVHAGRVALLPQDALFPDHARLGELLEFYAALQGIPRRNRARHVRQVLKWVHLDDRERAKTRTLSHGMRRRLAIAQAFLGHPELILLDEPLNGLDPREVANIRELLRGKRASTTIVVSSHLLTEIEAVCDHVVIIEQGRAVRQGTLSDFVGQRQQVTYALGAGTLPLAALEDRLDGVALAWNEEERLLTARFTAHELRAEDVNALVLPFLLNEGVEVREVRRGSNLEQAYLNGSGAR
jgi:ABC-2 type transport system ATP-binding protein